MKMLIIMCYSLVFFSSRRRHTRCSRDWSSDVCSSDLQGIMEKYLSNVDGYALRIQTGGTLQVYTMGSVSWAQASGSTVLSAGTWYHVAAVFDGGALRLYLNGAPDGTAATTFAPGDATGPRESRG